LHWEPRPARRTLQSCRWSVTQSVRRTAPLSRGFVLQYRCFALYLAGGQSGNRPGKQLTDPLCAGCGPGPAVQDASNSVPLHIRDYSAAEIDFVPNGPNGVITLTVSNITNDNFHTPWTAVTSASWITLPPPASGVGSASIPYSFSANTGDARSGTMTIAGQVFTLNQAGSTILPAGGSSSIGIGQALTFNGLLTTSSSSSQISHGHYHYNVASGFARTKAATVAPAQTRTCGNYCARFLPWM
jgi:Putative binding domain, N-terminal